MRRFIHSLLAVSLTLAGCAASEPETTETPPPTESTLAPMGAVQGFVRDYKTNGPIKDVTVTLYAAGVSTTTTDENGYWFFDKIRADDSAGAGPLIYTLTVPNGDPGGQGSYLPMVGRASLQETVGSSAVGMPQHAQTNSLTLVTDWMVQTATVSGFVTDSTTGRGINGATVVIEDFTAGLALGDNSWKVGASNAYVDSVALTTTTAARTDGGDGYYSLTVPALTMNTNDFGAFINGYEYAAPSVESSLLNLQFGSGAIVDFQLNPVDNVMGLVSAEVSVTADAVVNMLVLRDATGSAGTGAVPKVDMNGATQLVFSLVFDQAVDTSQFYGDTIQLTDNNGVVLPNLTAVWGKGNYAVTLTGAIDLFDDTLTNSYTLTSSRIIYAAGGGQDATSGQIAAGPLAEFNAYDSTLVATNPTPALFMEDTDSAIVGNMNVSLYTAHEQVNPTAAQNYTGMWEQNVLNPHAFTDQPLGNGIDIFWTDSAPAYDVSDISYYVRERNPASNEILKNWTEVSAGTTFRSDDRFIAQNLDIASQFDFSGGIPGQLRFGHVLDIAVVVDDRLGVENAIDAATVLTLSDTQAPELSGFFDFTAGGPTASPDYEDGMLVFSETMSSSAGTVSASNPTLFRLAPEWVVDATDGDTRLQLNAVGNASATVSTSSADVINAQSGVITFDTAGEADLFFVGQVLTVTYLNGDTETADVTAVDTAGDAPKVTIDVTGLALAGSDFTQAVTLTVSGKTTLRSGVAATAFAGARVDDTDIDFGGAPDIAVGDRLILRKSDEVDSDIIVTVEDYNSATGRVTIAPTDTTEYDQVIFPGDVLTASVRDEAGNTLHSDANEITPDAHHAWPSGDRSIAIR